MRAAQLELQRMPHKELLARAEHFMSAAAINHHLLSQAMGRIAELELQAASQAVDARQAELVANDLLQRPRWPWNRKG